MMRDIHDHSLAPLDYTGHEPLAQQFRDALDGPREPATAAERARRETEDALRDAFDD